MSVRTLRDTAFEISQFEDPLRPAAEREACLKPEGVARRQRILFLGNSYNPFSTACLQSLVESGYDTVVGFYDPFTKGTWPLIRNRLKSRGWGPGPAQSRVSGAVQNSHRIEACGFPAFRVCLVAGNFADAWVKGDPMR